MLQNQHKFGSDLHKTIIFKHTNQIKKLDAYGIIFEFFFHKANRVYYYQQWNRDTAT